MCVLRRKKWTFGLEHLWHLLATQSKLISTKKVKKSLILYLRVERKVDQKVRSPQAEPP